MEGFITAQIVLSHGTSYLPQQVLAEFIENGSFATHIRKMRVAYAQRQSLLLANLREKANGLLEVEPSEAGMHLIAWLPEGEDDREVSRKLWAAGIEVVPLSINSASTRRSGGRFYHRANSAEPRHLVFTTTGTGRIY